MKYFTLFVVLCAVVAFSEAAPRVKRSGDISSLLQPKMDLINQLTSSFASIAQSIQAQIQQKISAKMAMKQKLMGSLTSGFSGLMLPQLDIQGLIQKKINKKMMLLAPLTGALSPASNAIAESSAFASADAAVIPEAPIEVAPVEALAEADAISIADVPS